MKNTTKEPLHIAGDISVHTGNILPIIKKWLYSEQDIFLRELTSNAHDAILKRQKLSNKENLECPEGLINITVNETNKTLTFHYNGLGMDADEIQK
jgi:molecular chaperone HtpG